MLELAILGLLLESPMHGLRTRKRPTGSHWARFAHSPTAPCTRHCAACKQTGWIAEDAAPAGNHMVRRACRASIS